MVPRLVSRRAFVRQLLGAGAFTLGGLETLPVFSATLGATQPEAFRFAFLTDLHLLENGDLRSAEGIAACLAAVEALQPRPEFILVGGDLVNRARDLSIPEAEKRLSQFQQIWRDHTALPAHWTFGNHDLVGTSNAGDDPRDPHYGKGLFKERFHLKNLYYGFTFRGWRFIVLDDIEALPDESYIGDFFDDELAFLRADLDAHHAMPTIICTHIPVISNLATMYFMQQKAAQHPHGMKSLVCANGSALINDLPGHNIRAVLSGHLHHYERIERNGLPFINSGAVCGNYWKGPVMDCPEGFGIVDLTASGGFNFKYQPYGWNAV